MMNSAPFSSLIFMIGAIVLKTPLNTAMAPLDLNRRALFTACVGSIRSSSRSSLNVYFFPLTLIPPPALSSFTAMSTPFKMSCPYSAAGPESGPVYPRTISSALLLPVQDMTKTAANRQTNPFRYFIISSSSLANFLTIRHRENDESVFPFSLSDFTV